MTVQEITSTSLRQIKRQARLLSRSSYNKTYMQYLDQVAREQFGVRHYHEAQTRAGKGAAVDIRRESLMVFYQQACQEYYLEF